MRPKSIAARRRNSSLRGGSQSLRRRLNVETLEDRRLLTVFPVTSLNDAGPGSLREAIDMANATAGADEIHFSVDGTISLASQLPTISDALTIIGPGQELLTLDAGGGRGVAVWRSDGYRLLNIDDGEQAEKIVVEISGLTLTGGDPIFTPDGDGGAIRNRENLTITSSTISGNAAMVGGGISSKDGALTIAGSTISGNYADAAGGGIDSLRSTLTITDSTISENRAESGGGVQSSDGMLTITDSNISENWAEWNGGIGSYDTKLTITRSTIAGNETLLGEGGGIRSVSKDWPTNSTLTITDSIISGNTARGGGGIASSNALTIIRSTISENTASYVDYGAGYSYGYDGGGIRSSGGSIIDSTISGNTAMLGTGGGIENIFGTLTITGSTISENTGRDGGGILNNNGGHLTITNSTVSGNTAMLGHGGGIRNRGFSERGTTLTVNSSTISGNRAEFGGGISNNNVYSTVTISSSIVTGNIGIGSNIEGDFVSTSSLINGDALLGPLANNGGPTQTHALLPGSPAINAGSSTEMFDQRGAPFVRDDGNGVDIGSYELQDVTMANGDFDQNELYDCSDIDALIGEIAAGTNAAAFDLNGDQLVNLDDRDAWLAEAGTVNLSSGQPHPLGDADLNGRVNASDLNVIAVNWQLGTNRWCGGDFDGTGFVNATDLNSVAVNWQVNVSRDPAAADTPRRVPRAPLAVQMENLEHKKEIRRVLPADNNVQALSPRRNAGQATSSLRRGPDRDSIQIGGSSNLRIQASSVDVTLKDIDENWFNL